MAAAQEHTKGPKRPVRGGFGTGRAVFWNGGALWMGVATGQADDHAHHAIQVALAVDGPFRVRGPRGDWMNLHGAVVPPDARHRFDGAGHAAAILFMEPETAAGRAWLARHPGGGIAPLEEARAKTLAAPLHKAFESDDDAASLAAIAQRVIDELVLGPVAALSDDAPVDPRIAAAIDWIRARLSTPITLADAARAVHLSPGRFRHLFVAQTGTTFRAYLLWARVGAAVAAGMAGRSWTDAAQEAGFADSAHLGRTCRRMIGIAPGMLAMEAPAPAKPARVSPAATASPAARTRPPRAPQAAPSSGTGH